MRHLSSSLRRVGICHSLPVCFSTLKMDKSKTLTVIERGSILELHTQNLSQGVIANEIGRSKTTYDTTHHPPYYTLPAAPLNTPTYMPFTQHRTHSSLYPPHSSSNTLITLCPSLTTEHTHHSTVLTHHPTHTHHSMPLTHYRTYSSLYRPDSSSNTHSSLYPLTPHPTHTHHSTVLTHHPTHTHHSTPSLPTQHTLITLPS